jgi:hypothetical protein
MIEEVEELSPELQLQVFPQGKHFMGAEIHIECAGAYQDVAPGVSKCVRLRNPKALGLKPTSDPVRLGSACVSGGAEQLGLVVTDGRKAE